MNKSIITDNIILTHQTLQNQKNNFLPLLINETETNLSSLQVWLDQYTLSVGGAVVKWPKYFFAPNLMKT